jgi:ABC-type polysaccharide/polyol phosphate export systems, permease component
MAWGFIAIYWRDMIKFWRSKAALFLSLIQPVLWLIFYGVSMTSNSGLFFSSAGLNTVDYMTFMASGIIGMTILFTALYSGQNLQFDKQYGLMKQIVVSPLPRSQILIGITLSGITKCLIQTVIIILFGYVVGAHFFAGFTLSSILVSMLGLLLFSVVFASGLLFLSNAIALKVTNHDVSQALMVLLTLPLFFASNALYPVESLPYALRILCILNPLTYFINGVRYFTIGSDFYAFGINYSIGLNGLLLSIGGLVVFALSMFFFAYRIFRNVVDF